MENSYVEKLFFDACEIGDIAQAKRLLARRDFSWAKLVDKKTMGEERTCLHLAVLAGDRGLLASLVKKQITITNEKDKRGDTALHLAVWKYRVDMVEELLKDEADLFVENDKGETPLCIAVKLGFLDVVKKLVDRKWNTVQNIGKKKNVLHLAVERNRFKVVQFLTKEGEFIKELINQRVEGSRTKPSGNEVDKGSRTKPSGNEVIEGFGTKPCDNDEVIEGSRRKPSGFEGSGTKTCVNEGKRDKETVNREPAEKEGKRDEETVKSQPFVEGDTPLHIAARNKNEPIVDLLRKVPGVNKHALNSEGKTPLDVAREVTEYHESFRIIKKLTDHPRNPKPFMYCAPEVSQEKHKRATDMVDESFAERRNTELVVAALLATMTFTAVFTVPGGSYSDSNDPNRGTPIFLAYYMFKLFIIFDCIAFFLSLFVCIMWQMASELTTEDKMFFMTVSSLLTCLSFGFNSCGFMAAVYTILAHKDPTLAWVILGILLFIDLCGTIASIHQLLMFAVGRARFHRLCGVPRRLDDFVENVWERAERFGILKIIRQLDDASHDAMEGESVAASKKAGEEEHEHEHGYNCSCSSSPCLRNVPQSV